MKILKFGASWCAACLIMKPRWQEIEQENPWLKTEYFEYDDNLEEAKKYDIGEDIPVFIFLDKNGQEIIRLKGEVSKKAIQIILDANKEK